MPIQTELLALDEDTTGEIIVTVGGARAVADLVAVASLIMAQRVAEGRTDPAMREAIGNLAVSISEATHTLVDMADALGLDTVEYRAGLPSRDKVRADVAGYLAETQVDESPLDE